MYETEKRTPTRLHLKLKISPVHEFAARCSSATIPILWPLMWRGISLMNGTSSNLDLPQHTERIKLERCETDGRDADAGSTTSGLRWPTELQHPQM